MNEERPIKVDIVGSVVSAAWTVAVVLSWIYVALCAIKSFWGGNPSTGFSDPTPIHGFRARVWSKPSNLKLFLNALVSGILLGLAAAFLCIDSPIAPLVATVTAIAWIAARFGYSRHQIVGLSAEYRAKPTSFRLVVDCMVKPGSRYAIDIRRNRLCGAEWAKSAMANTPEEGETVYIVGGRSASCPEALKRTMAADFERANADARALGFQDLFDFVGYRLYWRMISDDTMATDDRKVHVDRWMETFNGCGYDTSDIKRWYGYLNSVRQHWELKPYIPSAEKCVDPYEIPEVTDLEIDQAMAEGEKALKADGYGLASDE